MLKNILLITLLFKTVFAHEEGVHFFGSLHSESFVMLLVSFVFGFTMVKYFKQKNS